MDLPLKACFPFTVPHLTTGESPTAISNLDSRFLQTKDPFTSLLQEYSLSALQGPGSQTCDASSCPHVGKGYSSLPL